ncbi:MAG: DNA repair protein RecN, partial [Alphaproteobacteria bacterium]|nr:DNA repair protein RecN [Alphaproteobacteria bacterium]
MLSRLSIRDVVLIDRLDLAFASGVVTLTGETGAGKSILLDALGLATGARSDAALLRAGAAQAVVTAVFEVPAEHPACRLAEGHGISIDGELMLRRVVTPDGRSRAFVNDQPCAVGTLRQLGALLVEVHGQFDTYALFDPAMHREALDEFAGLAGPVAGVASAHAAWRSAAEAEAKARDEALRAAQDEAFLRHASAELEALDPKPGEEQTLADQRALLAGGEKLGQAVRAALDELGAHKGVEGALRAAQRQLERLKASAGGRVDSALAALERAAVESTDAIAEIEALAARLDHDPAALERAEERLFALKAAARKHRVAVDDLAALRDGFLERLAALDDGGTRLEHLAAGTR